MTSPVLLLLLLLLCVRASEATCRAGSRPEWRSDGRCGIGFPLASGKPAQCNPDSDRPCCSDYGFCGNSPSHCRCSACVDYRNQIREPSCYFVAQGERGILESPNYPNPYSPNRDCCYHVTRLSREYCGVSLEVVSLDVGGPEEEGLCRRDWIGLPSCVPETGTRMCGNSTGQSYEYLFQPGATGIELVFHAGKLTEGRTGFRIKYKLLKTCSGPYQTQTPPISTIPGTAGAPCYTRITDPNGTINTPYFPQTYPDNLDCVYEFVRFSSHVCGIRMKSVPFLMEDPIDTPFGGACTDFLHLPSCGFLCGKINFNWVVHFQPGASSLKFHFHSNEKSNAIQHSSSGFLIDFSYLTECP